MSNPKSDLPALVLQHQIADACARSADPDVVAFGEALRVGGSLERFGLDFAPWLRGWLKAAAVERRDRAICELGDALVPQDRIERRLEQIFAERKSLPDTIQEALRQSALTAQAIIYPDHLAPISLSTIHRARHPSRRAPSSGGNEVGVAKALATHQLDRR